MGTQSEGFTVTNRHSVLKYKPGTWCELEEGPGDEESGPADWEMRTGQRGQTWLPFRVTASLGVRTTIHRAEHALL